MNNYDKNSIKTLSPRESIRESIGMYIGGSDSNGRHQLFTEAIANSIDEAVIVQTFETGLPAWKLWEYAELSQNCMACPSVPSPEVYVQPER